jgi:signal transduction histidine kinase
VGAFEQRLSVNVEIVCFDSIRHEGHPRLRTMAERAARLNETLEIDSAVGNGTRLRVTIPPRA